MQFSPSKTTEKPLIDNWSRIYINIFKKNNTIIHVNIAKVACFSCTGPNILKTDHFTDYELHGEHDNHGLR